MKSLKLTISLPDFHERNNEDRCVHRLSFFERMRVFFTGVIIIKIVNIFGIEKEK